MRVWSAVVKLQHCGSLSLSVSLCISFFPSFSLALYPAIIPQTKKLEGGKKNQTFFLCIVKYTQEPFFSINVMVWRCGAPSILHSAAGRPPIGRRVLARRPMTEAGVQVCLLSVFVIRGIEDGNIALKN
jgi:hypothetical protein